MNDSARAPRAASADAPDHAARHTEALRLLNDAAAELLAAGDAASLVEKLVPRFRLFLSADVYFHFLIDALGREPPPIEGRGGAADGPARRDAFRLRLHSAAGIDDAARLRFASLADDEGGCGSAVHQRRPLYLDGLADDSRAAVAALRTLGLRAYACVPLVVHGRVLGTLSFGSRFKDAFDEHDRRVVETLGHYVAIAWDRLYTTERLAASEVRYRDLTETVPQVIWTSDAQGRATYFNRRWCEYTGQSAEEAARADLFAFVHRDDHVPTLRAWRAATLGARPLVAEFRVRRADGEYRWQLAHAVPVCTAEGRVLRWCGTLVDIDDRRRAEAELRRSEERLQAVIEAERAARTEADRAGRLKDEFLATISHELRTPLNAILGWARLLRRPHVEAKAVAEGVQVIERNARVQAQLITDLLDVNRIVSGKLVLELETVRMNEVVQAALETVAPAAAEKRQRLEADLAPDLPPVAGDFARLQQIVWNLLSNAVKFTGEGALIRVSSAVRGERVVVEVRDEGEGIDPEFVPQVFERFRQADSSAGRRHGGLGLGLAIVRQLVQMHGGTVAAASEGRGRGARFVVSLPPQSPEAANLAVTGRWRIGEAESGAALRGTRVLVVDDQQDALDFLRLALEEHGAVPLTATSTAAALALLRSTPRAERPHVLVSDIGMPGEDGHVLIRRVRSELGLGPAELPAIALTAFAREEDQRAALAAGFQAHVAKPVQLGDLSAVILRHVRSAAGDPEDPQGRGAGRLG